jgi:hypothetical protein
MSPPSNSQTYVWSSKLEGWHGRARSHGSPHGIDFSTAKILMASRYDAMGGSGFNMALFELDNEEKIAVDVKAHVRILNSEDATAFSTLLDNTLALPTRQYTIRHVNSCQPNNFVSVAAEGNAFEEFRIYGYQKSMRDLEDRNPGDNGGQLPDALWELYGVIIEARALVLPGQEEDEEVLKAVEDRVHHLR